MKQLCLSSRSMLGSVFVLSVCGRKRIGVEGGRDHPHPSNPLLARPILVEADIVRIQVGKDLPA